MGIVNYYLDNNDIIYCLLLVYLTDIFFWSEGSFELPQKTQETKQ